ncbi:transmembrane protease serine 11B-like protein [Lucilia cuprina]|uniref:transmembrane protease serine 11B-like protein n=1 Tax=Lucilia cuprina TaxID=7375 RepID=UPI001F05D34E|nr:transmembrane protease serine 11B-like protein [Lucilia cuprina]
MRLIIFTTIITSIAYNIYAVPGGVYTTQKFAVAIIDQQKMVCGGSILSIKFVVTAAHCFERGRDTKGIEIIVGINDLNATTDENRKYANEIIIHPRYAKVTRDFDIALVHLNEDLTLGGSVERIDMVSGNYDEFYGMEVQGAGWSSIGEGYAELPTRQSENLFKVWYRSDCTSRKVLGPDAYYLFGPLISERMLCASNLKGFPGTCDGDDGSALTTYRYELIGILSWRYDCKEKSKPSVYISIPLMRSWIIRTLGNFEH